MTAALPEPQNLIDNKYAIVRSLGDGATGTVHEAENILVGKRVAIKVLHSHLAKDTDLRARFFAEARAASRIAHQHVVDIYDLGIQPDGSVYIVMELLRGETLESIIETRGAIAPAYGCELMLQMLSGLAAAHAERIVHRDLKPANIIVTHPRPDRPHVKVLDFGIAKGLFEAGSGPAEEGVLLGTPLYMSPEQARGEDVDERADIYSAAAILYEMLCGRPPYLASTPPSLFAKSRRGDAPPVSRLAANVPQELAWVIARAMAPNPRDRTPTVQAFARELMPFLPSDRPINSIIPLGAPSPAPIPLSRLSALPEEPVHIRDVDGCTIAGQASPANEAISVRDPSLTDSLLRDPSFPRPPSTPRIRGMSRMIQQPMYTADVDDLSVPGLPSLSPFVPKPWSQLRSAAVATVAGFGIGVALLWVTNVF